MGAEELDVDSDWKKARAFLVAFSTAVLLAWYFSADLNSISMLGVSIKIKANAHNAWLVVAIVNLYFLLRYIQKFPADRKLPDDAMQAAFEGVLISHSARVYHRYMLNMIVQYDFSSPGPKTKTIVKIRPKGAMKYREEWSAGEDQKNRSLERLRQIYGLRVVFTVPYDFETEAGGNGSSSGRRIEIDPNRYAVALSRIVGFFRGVIFTPWVSDYIFPVIFGFSSVMAAFVSWLTVNP